MNRPPCSTECLPAALLQHGRPLPGSFVGARQAMPSGVPIACPGRPDLLCDPRLDRCQRAQHGGWHRSPRPRGGSAFRARPSRLGLHAAFHLGPRLREIAAAPGRADHFPRPDDRLLDGSRGARDDARARAWLAFPSSSIACQARPPLTEGLRPSRAPSSPSRHSRSSSCDEFCRRRNPSSRRSLNLSACRWVAARLPLCASRKTPRRR